MGFTFEELQVIGDTRKNAREFVRVRVVQANGAPRVDIRAFFRKADETPQHTTKGICMSLSQIREVLAHVAVAMQELERLEAGQEPADAA